ncbi:transport protein SEC7 related protein [Nitzschia inconspicua]|uniref:Transport protein SEC7 related protein n=1 Tax=Nitzschia inconspicua TaxID=303405 RepID=A0A9K3KRR2_9STRA|nr:transport protein SEC7 related protein [Nitzschia inconspicua]
MSNNREYSTNAMRNEDEHDNIKPMFSLDFSLSPASENERGMGFVADAPFAGVASLSSINTAGRLVQKILDQVTLNDSPPINEKEDEPFGKVQAEPDGRSAQCPIQPLSMESPYATYKGRSNVVKQGHVGLASLCRHALNSIGMSETCLLDDDQNENLNEQNSRTIVSSHLSSSNDKFWNKSMWRKTKSNWNNSVDTTKEQKKPPDALRLQLYGSEYARYLSTTPLAPSDILHQKSKRAHGPTFRRKNLKSIQNIEEAERSVLTGPVTDIIVTQGDEMPPKGYYRLSQSASGEPFLLRDGKSLLHICVKKETNWDRAAQRPCVTSMVIIFPQRKEFVPPGYSVVRKYSTSKGPDRQPVNMNCGGSDVAYLCFRRSREGNPITGIVPLYPSRRESIPEGYTVIERTPRNFIAQISVSNVPVFLAYRQRLANLELLRPLPLIMSVYNGGSVNRKLNAYYSTGGTVVESRVGRFHIFDRSTHSLLSPSSIKNRLSLIEASRRKAVNAIKDSDTIAGEKYSYSGSASVRSTPSSDILSSSLLLANTLGTPCSHSAMSESDRLSSAADFESTASSEVNRSLSCSFGFSVGESEIYDLHHSSWLNANMIVSNRLDIERCIQAMGFIPTIFCGLGRGDTHAAMVLQCRVAVLIPVMTACYTRHGGSALIAVEGLSELLREDFFADDVNTSQVSSAQTTLLDMAVQVVCDVATTGSQDIHLFACVEFVERAMKYGCGYLSTRTIGYVVRFYLYVFYFGTSAPTGNWGILKASDKYILEDPRTNTEKLVLAGGAPQFAILALKDLFVFLVARLGSLVYLDQCVVDREKVVSRVNELGPLQIFGLVDKIVSEMVDSSVHRVDIANFTQLALHQISRSGGSELFWYEMTDSCGGGLFGGDTALREETQHLFALCFSMLANIVKIASSQVTKNKISREVPRDTASKLMSLEMIKFFLDTWERGPARQEIKGSHSLSTFAFCIRRLVVTCLLKNTSVSLDDPRVFRRTIQIVGTLWSSTHYRKHMKLEIGFLFDHFVLRLLKLGPQILFKSRDDKDMTYLFAQQLELMKGVQSWFKDEGGGALIELFLNFDTQNTIRHSGVGEELLAHIEWNISHQLCSSLCHLTERATDFLGEKIRESQSTAPVDNLIKGEGGLNQGYEGVSTVTLARESARRLRQSALDAITQIVQQLALAVSKASGHQSQAIIAGWKNKESLDLEKLGLTHLLTEDTSDGGARFVVKDRDELNSTSRPGSSSVLDYWQRLGAIKQRFAESKVEIHPQSKRKIEVYSESVDISVERRRTLNVAFSIASDRGLSKALDYLIACNVLSASPRDIASFLRIHRGELNPSALGKYLGEGGASTSETEYWNLIRFCYIRAISFVGISVEEGLRHLLTQGGFRLPGEAQQIDRIISTFSQCYWEDNAGDSVTCPFQNQDTIFLLSFAIIMLNTDLHKIGTKRNVSKKRDKNKMSKIEFINNLRGVSNGGEIDPEYLSQIYDQIEANPIVIRNLQTMDDDESVTSENIQTSIASLVDNAKSVDALLRGLSTHESRFVSVSTHAFEMNQTPEKVIIDLAREFFEKTWHEFHGLINSALQVAHLDPKALDSCVDLLKYSLSLTILLNMQVEQVAFLDQIGRLKVFDACRNGNDKHSILTEQESYKGESWYTKIESNAKFPSKNGHLESLVLIDSITRWVGVESENDLVCRKTIREAVRQLESADFLLNDPNRTFVRQGDLLKRANRSGRCVEYRFFLFSDVLIYAKRVPGSQKFRIHEELPLILMKVVDWFPPEMKKEAKSGIQFYHPRKKFIVFCSSHDERKSWVKDIRESIDKELGRKVAIEGARKAATNVPSSGTR